MDETVEECPVAFRLLDRFADDDERARQDFQIIGRSAGLLRPALHVYIKALRLRKRAAAGEDDFCGLGRELAASLGSAGLNNDGPALNRAGDIQRTPHVQEFALVSEDMHAVGFR
jgi:hypothetical protein